MSVKVNDGYEVTDKALKNKLSENDESSPEGKFLKEAIKENDKKHLNLKQKAEQILSPEEIQQQRQEEQKLIAEKMLKEQEEKRKIKEARQRSEVVEPTSVADTEFIQSKEFDSVQRPQTVTSKPKAINLQTQEIAKEGRENGGVTP